MLMEAERQLDLIANHQKVIQTSNSQISLKDESQA